MKYKAVIFDLDGTLLNTIEDLKNSVNYALESCGMPVRTLDEVRRFVGNGIKNLMRRAVPDGEDNPLFEKAFSLFKEHYSKNCCVMTKAYDGIPEMLDKLRSNGIKTAIVSNKAENAVKTLSDTFFGGMTSFGDKDGRERKPAPDTVFAALDELGVKPDEAVYSGDSEVDIMTAANAGMKCISVSWGFKGRKFLEEHNAEIIIDRPEEIFRYI